MSRLQPLRHVWTRNARCDGLACVTGDALRIRWINHDDECEARIGTPLRWRRRATDRQRRPGMWKQGRTVIAIDESGGVWSVLLDPEQRGDTWNNPIFCGTDVKVDRSDESG